MNFTLRNHPFAVEAFFESSLVLSFAAPKEQLQSLLPECLEIDSFDNKWGFVAAAMVQTRSLRPKGFPAMAGNDFFLIGYRLFVRYVNNAGKNLRGLYILKSETDKRRMQWLGNIFTHYRYTTTDIQQTSKNGHRQISSKKSDFLVRVKDTNDDIAALPEGSPFADWKQARRFAGPLPFTFDYDPIDKKVVIVEGVRENWLPAPVTVLEQHFSFIEQLNLADARLANAFIIRNIPYHWKKGKTESWIRQ